MLHLNSSTSIASDATTLILGETPATPKPKPVHAPSGLTPSPPSLPDHAHVVFREVLYVAESPRKMVKAEPRDEALKPTPSEPEPMDKEAAMQELALLEAYRNEQNKTRAAEAPPSREEDEITPTEPDEGEPELEQLGEAPPQKPEPVDKKAAMRELALLQAQLPQSRLFRVQSCGVSDSRF